MQNGDAPLIETLEEAQNRLGIAISQITPLEFAVPLPQYRVNVGTLKEAGTRPSEELGLEVTNGINRHDIYLTEVNGIKGFFLVNHERGLVVAKVQLQILDKGLLNRIAEEIRSIELYKDAMKEGFTEVCTGEPDCLKGS